MGKKFGRWVYGDKSYYFAHILIGCILLVGIWIIVHFILKQSASIALLLISEDTMGLSASLLGFQLAGVSILISLGGNKKMSLLEEINSDTMIYKVFLSSITMFLASIILMLLSLNFLPKSEITPSCFKMVIDYCAVVTFIYGIIFMFSSIRLLKWCCSK